MTVIKTIQKIYAPIMLALVFAGVPELSQGGDVSVLMSADVDASRKAFQGFRNTLRHRIVRKYDMKENVDLGQKFVDEIQRRDKPNLMFTVGAPALGVASRKVTSLPVVYAMVLNPARLIRPEAKNITGVSMQISVKDAIKLFKDLNPKIRKVGVVFDPRKSGDLIVYSAVTAKAEGIQLVAREIRAPSQAIQALNSMRDKIDALWMLPDETVLAPEVVNYMFLFSYRNNIPILGVSEKHTNMGALASLSLGSNEDIGRQAGELANRILSGIWPGTNPSVPARQTKLTVNLRAAEKFGMEFPESIIAKADNAVKAPVYKDGEWWVFRVKATGEPTREVRISYNSGKFTGDDKSFLSLSDGTTFTTWIPKAAMDLNNQETKWFDFPLLPGKKWESRYLHRGFLSGRVGWVWTDGEVIGQLEPPMDTQAGKFRVVEFRRTDYGRDDLVHRPIWGSWFGLDHVYFYSPQTKCVVKHIATRFRGGGRVTHKYEMELIKYGQTTDTVTTAIRGAGKK